LAARATLEAPVSDPIFYARAVHFAATIMAAGIAFFAACIAEPVFRKSPSAALAAALRRRFAWFAWISLAFCVLSGASWLVLTAASMSGQPLAQVYAQDVLWTVLSQTDFGNDWFARLVFACVLAGTFVSLLSAKRSASPWLKAAAVVFAAALVGSLAWAGHAIGREGVEGIVHPAADVLHLVAAAAWVGALVPLALLLAMTGADANALAVARTATLRFSTLGIVSVATLLLSGIVNTWYLAGSVAALTETDYGHLLLIKIALFFAMVGVAAVNRLRLTPRLIADADGATTHSARRALCRNAAIEAALGAAVIAIVAVLGTLPPGSHANHHAAAGLIPPDAAFQHIHGEDGMADVTIEPGRIGTASASVHLLNDDLDTLVARQLTLTLTAPSPGSKPATRAAVVDADGTWHIDAIALTAPGNWTVAVDALLPSGKHLKLAAPIVIDPK
jgi:putative copper resistance protein D